jgi:hypothetical protein
LQLKRSNPLLIVDGLVGARTLDPLIKRNPTQKKDRSSKVLKKTNKALKKIATLLDIATPIRFYVARHTSCYNT